MASKTVGVAISDALRLTAQADGDDSEKRGKQAAADLRAD